MNKKIGILTLHDSINFGAYLQAFALFTKLKELGYEPEFITFGNQSKKERLNLIKAKNPKLMFFKYQSLKKFDEARKKLLFSDINNAEKFHTIIIGSDEMWNLENNSFAHRKEYFGYDLPVSNVITYAPSCNNLSVEQFEKYTKGNMNFSMLNSISVRDENTRKLVNEVSNIDPQVVLDPTLLIDDYSMYIEPCSEKNFVLVYGYSFSEEEKYKITSFAKKNNKKLISIGLYNAWCDENIYATPFAFLGYLKAADYVFTSTFHGTIFSTLMETNFAVFGRKNHKVKDVLEKLNILDRDISNIDNYELVFSKEINYKEIRKARKALAAQSIKYLENAINLSKDINLIPKKESCCGCTACMSICPKDAIDMVDDYEGFEYPKIDYAKCIGCHACENICAFQNGFEEKNKMPNSIAYAVKHQNDNVRKESRSGGFFTAISDAVLEKHGIVYGCALTSEFKAIHERAQNKEQRDAFRKSKYVQSDMRDTFKKVKADLENGKLVLFSGTSCQCIGLKKYLGKLANENLITMDIVCHGVPSPKVWRDFLRMNENKYKGNITDVDFRNKTKYGWHDHVETIYVNGIPYDSDLYKKLFFSHHILRPACFSCPYKNIHHDTDITIADCWGIENIDPSFDDNKGVSLVLLNTERGRKIYDSVMCDLIQETIDIGKCMQPALKAPFASPQKRDQFWSDYNGDNLESLCNKYAGQSKKQKIRVKLGAIKRKLFD